MLVLMCGYPFSGKTVFTDLLIKHLRLSSKDFELCRPSDLYPDDIDKLPESKKSGIQINSWEKAYSKALNLISSTPKVITILDTCGTASKSLKDLVFLSKLRKSKAICIFIATPPSICRSRGDAEVVDLYNSKINSSLLYYKDNIDKILVVRDGDVDEWDRRAAKISTYLR